jgi:RIO kinase 1
MRRMFQSCRLVHADLSEYNLLYHRGRVVVIDVSQSVETDHPRALEFLRTDARNVTDYFARGGVITLQPRELFDYVVHASLPVRYRRHCCACS